MYFYSFRYVYEEEDNYAFVEVEENKEGEFEIVELEDYSEERPQQIE